MTDPISNTSPLSRTIKQVCVVGGGFTGMACASDLADAGVSVTLLERNSYLGGLATGFKEPGWQTSLEHFYHHWFQSDEYVTRYAQKWAALDGIIFRRPITVVETKSNAFVQLDSAVALLKYPDLGFVEKIRMGMALAYIKVIKDWGPLETSTAAHWCKSYMGEAGYKEIWEPMLRGKFGDHWANNVNMAWLWSRIACRTPKLGTFKGGFEEFVRHGEGALLKKGVQIRKSVSQINATQDSDGSWTIFDGVNSQKFDKLVIAASPHALEKIVPAVDSSYVKNVHSKSSLGARVIILSLKESLGKPGDPYWYSLRKTKESPFLAAIDHTQFVPASEYGGEFLVYLADYLDPKDKAWNMPDDELLEVSARCLKRINPRFQKDWIRRHWVYKEAYAQPIPEVNASKSLLPIVVPGMKNLFHASMSHVYPWDRGTNFAFKLGQDTAKQVLQN